MMVLTLPLKGQHGVGVGDSVPKMVGEEDGESTFSPTNLLKDYLNVEKIPQNNFWTLAEDTRHPER